MKMRCFASSRASRWLRLLAQTPLHVAISTNPRLCIALLWRVSSLLLNLILTKNLLLLHSTYCVSQGRRTGQGSMAICFVSITRFLRVTPCISHCAGNYRACSHTGKIGVTVTNGTSLGFISRILSDFGTCVSCFPAQALTCSDHYFFKYFTLSWNPDSNRYVADSEESVAAIFSFSA